MHNIQYESGQTCKVRSRLSHINIPRNLLVTLGFYSQTVIWFVRT